MLSTLLRDMQACQVCAADLPLGPRPVLRASKTARVLIIGQAPGTKVHASGKPWDDRSGDRLRNWMQIEADTFYDENRIAIMPMGFCYPGVDPCGGDLPPHPECAPLWHQSLLDHMPRIGLALIIGSCAQAHYLKGMRRKTMTATVATWRDYPDRLIPLPHPSWRNTAWLGRNPWFETNLLPDLRARLRAHL
ncbi:MAG: uracil-DNA glycosylase [Rhodospirillaceae bacterium]|nr:uracil-DNA glycosylase [Rhodospirillaceae bacterium]|tara:strand:+ start:14734 stop:15309 length:576 start_codon:yes stop_codon:yes gene_type:complete